MNFTNQTTNHQAVEAAIAATDFSDKPPFNKNPIADAMPNRASFAPSFYDDYSENTTTTPPPQNATKNENVAVNAPFPIMSFSDLVEAEYKPDWLVDDLIERGNLGLVFGSPASGKSLLVQDMAFCIAAGLEFHTKQTQQGNVLYIAGEGFSGLSKRFKALKAHYGCDANGLYLSRQPAAFMDIASAKAVADTIALIGNVSLVVIDTLHRNMGGGDENSSKDWGNFQNNIDNYLRPLGCAVVIVHHSGHSSNERSRGSSSIRGSMDIEFSVTKDDDKVTLTNTKMKDFEPPKPMAFTLEKVDQSVVLKTAEYTPKKSVKRLSANAEKTLSALKKSMPERGVIPPASICELFPDTPLNIPKKVINIEEWREFAYSVITVDGDKSDPTKIQKNRRTTFQRNRNELEKMGLIGIHGGYAWIIDSQNNNHNFQMV